MTCRYNYSCHLLVRCRDIFLTCPLSSFVRLAWTQIMMMLFMPWRLSSPAVVDLFLAHCLFVKRGCKWERAFLRLPRGSGSSKRAVSFDSKVEAGESR